MSAEAQSRSAGVITVLGGSSSPPVLAAHGVVTEWARQALELLEAQKAEIAVLRRLLDAARRDIARLKRDLRVERAVTRHDAQVRAQCEEGQ